MGFAHMDNSEILGGPCRQAFLRLPSLSQKFKLCINISDIIIYDMISDTGPKAAEQLVIIMLKPIDRPPIPGSHLQALLRRCKLQSGLFSVRHCMANQLPPELSKSSDVSKKKTSKKAEVLFNINLRSGNKKMFSSTAL